VVFVPILALWAFYRIKKLKKYFIYVYIPQIIIGGIIAGFILGLIFEENSIEKLENFSDDLGDNKLTLIISNSVLGLVFTILSIYLIVTWSEKWNKQFSHN
jgi:hypothetical protein